MSGTFTITVDGVEIEAKAGQTILEAAEEAGIYIPRLCHHPELHVHGSCRVCTVKVNGKAMASCTQPAAPGMIIENESEAVREIRCAIVDMLFVEGNHFCMFCEKSGNCELQALAYRFGITVPQYPYQFPQRDLDGTHPDIFIDRNRCILCGRCVRASRDVDGKNVFEFVERGHHKRVAVNAEADLSQTDAAGTDKAIEVCPVGALLPKHIGYKIPVGERLYDEQPIGSDVEAKRKSASAGS